MDGDDTESIEDLCDMIDEYPRSIGWPLAWLLFWWLI